ncbi:MAG: Metallopeptidase-like protein [Candidatus Woesebacteria bacterium GW2011_GWA1_37_7]|uniref:Metallopeptidase-like protein n=1 Tax=Candidatus Woesebacteria bacterium GW2011_GWA1_37_7 TaxID=1618545 RepID=A0A0G0KAQ8_9BACT|nr:MAG: Metallopeptidase-like protein [Candidatus Woesebacteria bacterium GW2011_GWA1_37_7]
MRKKKSLNVVWHKAPDIKRKVVNLKKNLDLDWVNTSKIFCFRSTNSQSRAYARIWGLAKIWQLAFDSSPYYIIEVLAEKFDHLSDNEKDKVLLHEIAHIPKNFSGSLLPHIRRRGKRNFHSRVEDLVSQYLRISKIKQ